MEAKYSLSVGEEMLVTEVEVACRTKLMKRFFRDCCLPERIERYTAMIDGEKGHKKLMSQIDHFQKNLDLSSGKKIPAYKDSDVLITASSWDGSGKAFVMSSIRGLKEGGLVSLSDGLRMVYGMGNGAFICFGDSKARVHVYFGEEIGENYFWSKP